ncbi:hypothetical protein ACIBKZ_23835 [Streptomyces sp. NPDC050421]|uniref:hypothetical protein n=1 Tax=unclassified Streptomyces TaxID=2593676 RepID=UPI0037AD68A9
MTQLTETEQAWTVSRNLVDYHSSLDIIKDRGLQRYEEIGEVDDGLLQTVGCAPAHERRAGRGPFPRGKQGYATRTLGYATHSLH